MKNPKIYKKIIILHFGILEGKVEDVIECVQTEKTVDEQMPDQIGHLVLRGQTSVSERFGKLFKNSKILKGYELPLK